MWTNGRLPPIFQMKDQQFFRNVAASVGKKIEEHQIDKTDIIGIGVGVPAPVTSDGVVNGSANLGWKYKEVKRELEELSGLKTVVGNDANVAALGEMWKGGGAGENKYDYGNAGNRSRRRNYH